MNPSFGLIAVSVCLSASAPSASAACKKIFDVQDLVRSAASLDGEIICVRGLLALVRIRKWNATFVQALLQAPAKGLATAGGEVGLIEWSQETGVSEEQYKPGSFDKLQPYEAVGFTSREASLEVVLRGALKYKRNLREKIPPGGPSTPETLALIKRHFDVELVILEVLNVKKGS